ncbi:LPS-assembly protein LptD [Aerophototrophica crusticola]|uniref:LPS-assembly protein LptD n=2 Tax=Aerophototrophica crusticola TaxID=1709002 RepID=A0A858RBB9_9PROT|nr:LPS-assembly protein LptD [Rhodospirillaceae bacterium B3]
MPSPMTFRRRLLGTAVAACFLLAGPALAQPTGSGQPVLLSADSVDYDDKTGIVTASGRVELAQGTRILLADKVQFSEKTNVVTASGNVSMLEPSGEVVFADYVELADDMRQGFIDRVRVLMADNSRIAAAEGERVDGRYVRMEKAVYSPCDLCQEDPTRSPLWQIRAARVTHDTEAKEIYYRDALLEIGGIPVAYTPFFSHPDPSVKRRSGFLAPGGGFNSDIGTYARIYYFFDIDPSKDFTLEVTPSTEDGLLLGGQYRQRFSSGSMTLSGSATYAERTEGFGAAQTADNEFRWHAFGNGRFDINQQWRWGFDLERTSDDSHLRRYDYSEKDLLTSRAFVERFNARDYLSLNAYSFQDLRPGNPEEEPLVFPLATYSALGEPGSLLGGRWSVDGNLLALTRADGTDTRRISAQTGWRRDLVAPIGLVNTFAASIRADAYWANDYRPTLAAAERDNETSLRVFPQAQWMMSFPLARQSGTVQQLIEPIVMFSAAPNNVNDDDIPNEDSQDIEFDHSNLFLPSRFPGVDRLEGGQRVTYGVKAGLFGFGGGSSSLFLGQSYRLQEETDFPQGSGLEKKWSDVVGRLQLTPSPWLDLSYSFRLDSDTLAQRRHEAYVSAGPAEFRVNASYLYLDRLTLERGTASQNREELTVGVNSSFSRYWSAGVSHRRDLAENGGPIATGLVLTYQDECLTFQLVGERDFTQRSGIDSGDRVFFRLVFKNLGEFLSPSISGNVFGQQDAR